jgi:hypothetical protein
MSLLNEASLFLTPNAYKEGKLYSIIPSNGNGDFTVTRATTATRVNSAGLVQLVPYNLVSWSEMFTDIAWNKSAVTISANVATAPNGTLTADKIIATAVNTNHILSISSISFVSLQTYTFSYYAKSAEYTKAGIRIGGAGYATVNLAAINLVNGTIISQQGFTSLSVTNQDNGWCRIAGSFVAAAGLTPNIHPLSDSYTIIADNFSYLGDGTSGILAWGAQLNEGTSALTYLRTETRLNIPRLDYSLGSCPNILLEPQRTNTIRNSTNVGAVVGTPGTLPTNWSNYIPSLIRTIVGTGTENGLNYIDIRLSGTASDLQSQIIFDSGISTSASVAWTQSAYLKLKSGTLPLTQLSTRPTGTGLPDYGTIITVTSTLTRFFNTFTVGATATAVSPRLYFNHAIGTAIDFTIRIAGTQLELGAYATSYIPTTSASVTRNADVISRGNIFTNGLITASGGTWFVDLKNNIVRTRDNTTTSVIFGDVTGTNTFFLRADFPTDRISILKRTAGTPLLLFTTTATTCKIAIKWNGSTADIFQNGVKVIAATSFSSTNLESLVYQGTTIPFNINSMALYPIPLSDTECINLTTI